MVERYKIAGAFPTRKGGLLDQACCSCGIIL
jgi:hypothetical protein